MSRRTPRAFRTGKRRAKKRVLIANPDRYIASDLARLVKGESGLIGKFLSVPGAPPGHSREARLSARETQIFESTGDGLAPAQIARKMKLSVKTVECYRQRIREKLGLKNAAEMRLAAVAWMRTNG